jgi:hypothetical protein
VTDETRDVKPPLASVDELREELRRLGYFDSGLDRFVLGGDSAARPRHSAAAVAARLGLLGGALFGAATLLAAVGFDRALLAEPRDLALLALYLFVAFAVATGLAALAAGALASALARRGGRGPSRAVARNAGLLAALPGVVYVAFWWRSHLADAGWVPQLVALALCVPLLAALGRFGSLAAVAVLARHAAGALPEAELSRRSVLPLVALALPALVAGLAAAAWFEEAAPAAPDFAVRSTGLRVRVIGVDGLERRMAQRLLDEGALPGLQALMERGAHAALQAEPEQVPAIVWTTIATGRGPEAHGIQALGPRRLVGMRTPLLAGDEGGAFAAALASATDVLRLTRKQAPTSVLRSAKTFWNVAADKGLRVGVVNWWATWPADPAAGGYIVTDRAFFRLEKGGAPDREVEPETALAPLRAVMSGLGGERPARIDHFALAAAAALRPEYRPDLEAVYLPGLDIEAMQLFSGASAADLATLSDRLHTLRAAWQATDAALSAEAATLGEGEVLVVVGDPGRLARQAGSPAEGLLVVVGGPARPAALPPASARDVAPTVLHLLGLPRSDEMDGRVLEAALTPEFLAAHPVRRVAAYGARPATRHRESGFDRQMLEELKALGYVQ